MPANPDKDRVMGALSSPLSITTPTIPSEGKPDVAQTPPPVASPAQSPGPGGSHDQTKRLLTDEELFEDYKLKGNKFVKQVCTFLLIN